MVHRRAPSQVGFERNNRRRFIFVGPRDGSQQYAVAVKGVPAESEVATLWISTAFPVSRSSLQRLSRRHRLIALV